MAVIDKAAYGELLAATLPGVIRTDRENECLITEMERIDSLPHPRPSRKLSPSSLRCWWRKTSGRYDIGHAEPLAGTEAPEGGRGLRQRDLIPVFGSSSVASDVLNGKTRVSNGSTITCPIAHSKPFLLQ